MKSPARLVSLRTALVCLSAAFYLLHFVHLSADFPGGTAWVDWSRYTDEGWYSDAAIRHNLLGHWFLAGDFNAAVALPVWPLLEAVVFRFSGVSLIAARALTVVVFGVMLLAAYRLLRRYPSEKEARSLAGAFAVLFFCVSPFFFAFERIAILEPLVGTLAVLALLAASHLQPWPGGLDRRWFASRRTLPTLCLGVLLPAMVLTKPTAVALLPAVVYLVWARGRYRLAPFLRLGLPPVVLAVTLWSGYYLLMVRPYHLEDYRYLFTANDYTGFQQEPLAGVALHTVADGAWMGVVLYPFFFLLMALFLLFRPRFFRNPLVPALLLWVSGYLVFLGYQKHLQSRYYLLLAVPVILLVAVGLDELLCAPEASVGYRIPHWRLAAVALSTLAIAIPDATEQIGFLLHPSYTFLSAAEAIARTVRATPNHSPLLLSVSGSDLSLMTGLPSINTEFGTMDLDERVRQYRPGWYVAWNEFEDEDMKAIAPLYQPVRVAEFPAMDDPDRNVLLLYRLDPVAGSDSSGIRTRSRQGDGFGNSGHGGHHGH